jgi:uncharacterized protein
VTEHQQPSLAPVAENARIDVMDILRGFALVGIVFMNIEWFNRSGTDLRSFDTSLTGLDHAVGWLIRAFVEGKFYKLFALLFGMGFAVMLLRAKEVGRPFGAWFVRRMLVLLIIGLAHNVLVWDGDILHDYAFAGLVFLAWIYLFQSRWLSRFNTPSAFLKIGVIWLLLPIVVVTIAGIRFGVQTYDEDLQQLWQYELDVEAGVSQQLEEAAPDTAASAMPAAAEFPDDEELGTEERKEREIEYWVSMERKWDGMAETEVAIMSGDSYAAAVRYRAANLPRDAGNTLFFTAVLLIPIFLVGYWFVASGVLRQHRAHTALFRSLAAVGLTFGTMVTVAGLLMLQHPIANTSEMLWTIAFWLFNLGQLVLAAGYLGAVVLLSARPLGSRVLQTLAPFGRMALTNYIMQSVIFVLLFHGYAGGLYGSVSRAQQMLVVIAILAVQIIFSTWWLNRFRFGPLEWLWRSATYMSWQRLRI